MRLIDADALKAVIEEEEKGLETFEFQLAATAFINHIEEAPTIDAVPVVRCRDCKWWTKQEKSIQGRCALYGMYPTGGWYCANGRRDDED